MTRDKRQPEDTIESFISDLSYQETLLLIVMFMVYVILRDVIRRDVLWHLSSDFCICFLKVYLMTLVYMLNSNFNP